MSCILTVLEGKCSWGKIPTNLLASSLESCVNLSLGHIVELASKVTMRPSFLEVCQIDSPLVVFKIHIPKGSIIMSTCLGLKGFVVVLCMQPKFLEQDSCLTFCSHKVDAAVRSPLFVTFVFNMILSRGLHVSLITNATNMFFESKISVANR